MNSQPRDNQSIYQHVKYYKLAAKAIKNYQNKFGIKFDVYRVEERGSNKDILSWGPSNAQQKRKDKLKYCKTVTALNSPNELYNKLNANQEPLLLKLGSDELLVGDIVKVPWVNDRTLEYSVNEQPQTYGGVFFIYNLEPIFHSGNSKTK